MKALLLVGGEGTRLRPLTQRIPKALVPVLNKPFLAWQLEYLRRAGITEVVLATGYLSHLIEATFGDGGAWGVRLTYSVETAPLGSAGAVKQAEPYLDGETFLVLNGDIFTDLDLRAMLAFHRERRALVTIATTPVEDPSHFGVVVTEPSGRITQFVEKPPPSTAPSRSINAGIYLLETRVLAQIPSATPSALERGLFPSLARRGGAFYAFPFSGFWLDMGTLANYLALHRHLLRGGVVRGEGVMVDPGVKLRGPVVLGPGCQVEEGATIEEAVLWEGVRVGGRAVVRRAIVASGCSLPPGCRLEGAALGEGQSLAQATPLAMEARR